MNTFSRSNRVRFISGDNAGLVGTVFENRISDNVVDVDVYFEKYRMTIQVYEVPVENLEKITEEQYQALRKDRSP